MSNFGSIRKLPSGNYQARYKIRDTEYKAPTTFPTKTMARQWLTLEQARIYQDMAHGIALTPPKPKLQPAGTYALEWLDQLILNGFSPDTQRTQVSRWNAHLKPFFAKLTPDQITPETIICWDRQTKWKSPNVRQNAHRALSVFLQWMVDEGLIDTNPMPKIKIRKPRTQPIAKVITPEEIERLRDHMPAHLRIIIDLAAWCGLRFGEVSGLERADINLNEGTIHIQRATHRDVSGAILIGSLKTDGSDRVVHMPPAMIERMRHHLDNYCAPQANAPVAHGPNSMTSRLGNSHMQRQFKMAYTAAGIAHLRFHDLRHTALTLAGQAGATVAELKQRAGHVSTEVAMRYQTATSERDKLIAQRLGG